ncbi:hypothetical protein [Agrobacterium tumefaciens]|uniref:hypothetical protein n=1 Tax=Agrobacterium tumefaciens TaxID=358 RepID=UPI001574517B|nr:hypothetical protein [Agrobacterium tumefaciens]WCJ62808.1 hypothetical protein G6M15_00980 [Agrobacterium tumefaciens]
MRLENDIAIRRQVRHILSDDVALGVGDGLHQLAGRALLEIQDATDGKVNIRQVKERSGKLSIFTDIMIRGVPVTVEQRVFDVTNAAAGQSAFVCEMCGSDGRLTAGDRLRVRCQACAADDPARERVWRAYKPDIQETAAYYVGVCLEHGRLFPVKNIVTRTCVDDRDHRLWLDEVHDRLTWFRAGSWIDGVNEALRDEFGRLDFGRR